MGFREVVRTILAGSTLIAQAIQSQNYAAGTAGWRIAANGDAEFNSATIRGDLIVGNPPTTGMKIVAGIPAALVTFYASRLVSASTFSIQKYAGDGLSYFYEIAGLRVGGVPTLRYGDVDSVGNVLEYFVLQNQLGGAYQGSLDFPDTQNPATGISWTFGKDYAGTNTANNRMLVFRTDWYFGFNVGDTGKVDINVPTFLRAATQLIGSLTVLAGSVTTYQSGASVTYQSGATLAVAQGAPMTIDGTDAPRGVIHFESIQFATNSGAVAGTENLILTTANITWRHGRAYRVTFNGQVKSAAIQYPVIQLRKTNVAGASLVLGPRTPITVINSDLPLFKQGIVVVSGAVDVVAPLALTCTPQVATLVTIEGGASGQAQAYFEVEDIGSTAKYSGATV